MRTTGYILRPDLGTIAYEYALDPAQTGFIGGQVLPLFQTTEKTAQYPVIPTASILDSPETQRAPRAAYARGDYELDYATFDCQENGYEEPLDDAEANVYRNFFDAEAVAVKRAMGVIMRSYERRVAKKVMDTTKFENKAVSAKWNDYANANPLADVNAAKEHFRYTVGLKPNALVLDEDVLRHISMCDAVVDRVKYTSPNAIRGELTLDQLKAYFGVANILVGNAVRNAAGRKQQTKIETIWPTDKVLLACVSSGGQDLREPSIGRTFLWTGDSPDMLTVEQYREEQTRSTIYRCRQNTDECVQFRGAGYILTGVVAKG